MRTLRLPKRRNKVNDMTGEMSKADVTKEAYPLHFAIARALKGTVHPFDMYQGPYVRTSYGQLWISEPETPENWPDGYVMVWNERTHKASTPFWPWSKTATRRACRAAREVVS